MNMLGLDVFHGGVSVADLDLVAVSRDPRAHLSRGALESTHFSARLGALLALLS